MSDNMEPNRRTGEQTKALAEAAAVVVAARREAAAILRRADTELLPEERDWFVGDGCGGALAPPPTPHFCLCPRYRGNGHEPCVNTFVDDTGPDLGTGSPRVRCRHPKDSHGRI
ncbi:MULTISPECIES: DUF6422 family protein [unclassified Streptomyces]|uniref:DUF6422 family protein n=1 Tax=unclassified Streptomyces TaxID=2593676 RepID=UPI001654C708|nr:DUF6422 family protein [Streptomyces sp. CB02980]MCB8905143.1 hypothetical protein [Streptomyces sp. CB02980]